jgi:uncharacterized protein (TIGR03083 family)
MKEWPDVVADEGARIVAVARAAPLDARVPHMRRWRLADVLAHLGGVHRWAADIVASQQWSGAGHRRGRPTGEELVAWFEEGLGELVATLRAADPATPCGNWSPGSPSTVGFWLRRQAHETAVHRWDAEAAAELRTPIPPDLATDGIDEVLTVFRRTRAGQPLDGTLGLTTSDTGRSWLIRPAGRPGRITVSAADGPTGDVDALVRAPAETLLLAVWGRQPISSAGIEVTGREAVARAFLPGPQL